jgi:hypothetical protein
MPSKKPRSILAIACVGAALLAPVAPSFAFRSGDVPAPVDGIDDGGPGKSHLNNSGVSGFDGNQGNDKVVGNAHGRPAVTPLEDGGGDGGEDGGGEYPLPY